MKTLTVQKTGTGSALVTTSPAGIDCGATCSADFAQGTAITLNVVEDPVTTFLGWIGDPECNVGYPIMTDDISCVARLTMTAEILFIDGFESGNTGAWQ